MYPDLNREHIVFAAADTTPGGCSHGDIQLASRTDDSVQLFSEGRLEMCVNNVWSTVCGTAFSAFDGHVACVQLGFVDPGNGACLFLMKVTACLFFDILDTCKHLNVSHFSIGLSTLRNSSQQTKVAQLGDRLMTCMAMLVQVCNIIRILHNRLPSIPQCCVW